MPGIQTVDDARTRGPRTIRVNVDSLDHGWSTRSYPHLIDERQLYVANNTVFNRDGLVSKRPGNILYGGGSGATGGNAAVRAMTRFYPVGGAPTLVAQSGGKLWAGNDGTGAFTEIGAGISATNPARFVQVYDPDMSSGAATALLIADGAHVPMLWDGINYVPVQTGGSAGNLFLPNGRGGAPITPAYVTNWKYNTVYAGEPTEPTGLYISDSLRPERFNGYAGIDSAGTTYTAYFPAGRDGTHGVITGLATIGGILIIFFTSGIAIGVNTGTYGAYEYEFAMLSTSTGCVAPMSIVSFEGFVVFFGGDRFYATDGQSIVPLPDEIPSVYLTTSTGVFACEMTNKAGVVGVRRGLQYWAAYDGMNLGTNNIIAVFDIGAGGGWTYGNPTGGAWARWPTGMPLACGIECRGPGDNQQMFWGSSTQDRVAQHDTGVYSDFGVPITVEARAKAFFLDEPVGRKNLQLLYVVGAFPTSGASYVDTVTAYVVFDSFSTPAPAVAIAIKPSGTLYGTLQYGTFLYGPAAQIFQYTAATYPQQERIGTSVQPGVVETSSNPFNLIGFVMQIILTEPQPEGMPR